MTAALAADLGPVLDGPFTGWQLQPGVVAAVAVSAALYAAALVAVARDPRRRAWPPMRTASFTAGLGLVLVALQSGLDARADALLSVHMAQHLVLSMLAAPLLIGGAPLALALRALRGAPRRALAGAVRGRPGRLLTRPAVTWTLSAAIVLAVHVPAVYGAALTRPAVHAVEHQLLLLAGLLFWLPLIDGNPIAHRLGWFGRTAYLLAAMVPMAALGTWFVYGGTVRYAAYEAAAGTASALEDQQLAGALMWVGGKLVMAAALLVLVTQALLGEERRQTARDAHRAARRGDRPKVPA